MELLTRLSARHEYSKEEMEANRIKFYERFAKIEADNQIRVVEPISVMTCEDYTIHEKYGRIRISISCRACRDRTICLVET